MSEITLTKTSSFDFFQFKIWHALWTSLQLWHVVKRFASFFTTKKNLLFQNLYHWNFSNPKFDTFWTFRFKVWHFVRDGIQNIWHFLCSCYQNPNILFSIHNLAIRKLFLPILTRCKQLFLKKPDTFQNFELKIWRLQKSITKISPVDFFQFKIWHLLKQFGWVSDTRMKFIIGILYVDNFCIENLTRWNVFVSKPLRTLNFPSHKLTNLLCQFIIWHWEEVCFRFWHVVENILVKLWHDLKSWKAKIGVLQFSLTKISLLGFFFNSKSDTSWKLFVEILTLRRIF